MVCAGAIVLTMTMAVKHLISPATLPKPPSGGAAALSVMTYNVLLPNSQDGWWNYKMYNPPLLNEEECRISSWEYRQNLLKEKIQRIDAVVVCLQEVSPDTFEEDFAFMADLGYDGREIYKKGRFRPATFWKTAECSLASPPVHKDRSLITAFIPQNEAHIPPALKHHWFVVNVHLQAGKQGPRRVRQMNEAIKGSFTLARKLKEPEPEKSIRLIVCGDMNGGSECGAVRFLEDGYIDETFREDNEPVSSGRKNLPLSEPMMDATSSVVRVDGHNSPPTMVVAELMSSLMPSATYDSDKAVLSEHMIERLNRIYSQLATRSDGQMSTHDVENWLIKINHKLQRGDEYRNAAAEMGWVDPNPDDAFEIRKKRVELPAEGILTLEGFVRVYQKELEGGKFWGIAHDMGVLGDPLPDAGLFRARYDRMYCSRALRPTAVIDTIADRPCPNDAEPSDHLPVAVAFESSTTE